MPQLDAVLLLICLDELAGQCGARAHAEAHTRHIELFILQNGVKPIQIVGTPPATVTRSS